MHVHEVFGDTNDWGALFLAVECRQLLEFIIHLKQRDNNVEQLHFKDRGSFETFVYNHHPTCHKPLVEFSYAVASKSTHCHACITVTNHDVLTVVTAGK